MCKHWACHRRQDGALHRSRLLLGAAAEAIGVVVLVVGMADASLAAFLVGDGLAGAGVGVLFKSALATLLDKVEPAKRGERPPDCSCSPTSG
jgi:hypothetical protein